MLNINEETIDNKNNFMFSKLVLGIQMLFFGGWNGLQVILQPQDLSVLVTEKGWINNYFFTMSYTWQNIPLLSLLLLGIACFWSYLSVLVDYKIINNLKRKDDIYVIPYKDKDNITVFVTSLSLFLWTICFFLIYLIPLWDMNFLTNLFYDLPGLNKVEEPLYLLLILIASSVIITLRTQLLFFYSGGSELETLHTLKKNFILMKSYYIKTYLINLLYITLSMLIYKHVILNLFFYFRSLFNDTILVKFPLIVNRIDVLTSLPSFILLFLMSSFIFSPIVIYLHRKIIYSQYDFFKQQTIKLKNKKNIDENLATDLDSL